MPHDTPTAVATRPPVAAAPPKGASARAARADVTVKSVQFVGEDRRRMIAEAAYFRAEQRGFVPGNELEDWLAAELEIDAIVGADEPR
jgi:hypothetical protein